MKREDLLSKIRREASRLEPSPLSGPVRADDLLKYDGEEFIDILYRRILRREPDEPGKAHYLDLVDRLPKPLLVYFLSRSEEARRNQAEVTGVYSALMRSSLKIVPSALMNALFSVMKKAVFRIISLSSSRKAEKRSEADYFKFYFDFEEEFRGSEKVTEQNLRIYLPLLQVADDMIIDLGSGRGEWLRLLKKEGFSAKGVEINPYFAKKCQEEGLKVIRRDGFEFLKNTASSSIGAITAFHLIEHLDPRGRLLFLTEIYRVLRPGGTLILETPNPRNILVSAGDFWRDVEHTTPVFPDTLAFMAKFAGFPEAQCYFFQENRTALIPCLSVEFKDLKDYVEVSRDVALFARKS